MDTYTHRLRHRPIRDDLFYLKSIKEELCSKRLEIAKNRKSEKWTKENLVKVLKSLKTGKSRDPHGIISEIFKPEVAGQDFQNSLLILLNKVKDELKIPDFMELANIVSIYKGKGEKMDLENDRGIFIVNKFRDILMKLSYQDKYEVVDRSMSDSNVGGRKNKNIRNHIFVVNSVINEVIQNKKHSIDIEILDYKKCFDSMWMEECVNDLWEAGVQDDQLALIYKINEKVNVAVNTPFGITERKFIERIVMQGEVYGPLCCSVQVDTSAKECVQSEKFLYKYKDTVDVPPLAMVDDLLLISNCGLNSVLVNGFINSKTNFKKLQYGVDKCHKMHVGSESHLCPDLSVDNWEVEAVECLATGVTELVDKYSGSSGLESSDAEKYLGDVICNDGKNKRNSEARKGKGF